MNIIDRRADGDAIFFGAEVDLESNTGTMTVRIVGSDEIDPARRFISVDSPLARALLKKQVDDQVSIQSGVDSGRRQKAGLLGAGHPLSGRA